MRSKLTMAVACGGLLVVALAGSWLMPWGIGEPSAVEAFPGGNTLTVNGVVRDFTDSHIDFGGLPSGVFGHHAGNVALTIGPNGRPVFNGFNTGPVTEFTIVNGAVVPSVSYVPMISVLGSAIVSGDYDMPVTVNVHLGSQTLTPFGAFSQALAGNVNDSNNPRDYVHNQSCPPNTAIWIDGRSWKKKSSNDDGASESDWEQSMTQSSQNNTQQIKVLRDGDLAPAILGYNNQTSIRDYLRDLIDTDNRVQLDANQVIFLFELGTTNLGSSAADFQDLVVLVTLGQSTSYLDTLDSYGQVIPGSVAAFGHKVNQQWRDANANPIPQHLYNPATDTAGQAGPTGSGGIESAASFDQWFADVLGTNLSARHAITLTKTSGVWEYRTNDFHPIDDQLLGNEGDDHNYNLTYSFELTFTHHAGQHRFIEFEGGGDAWIFIDGQLAMDLGGARPGTRQYVDVDRLGLSDGQPHTLAFFHAQRQPDIATFNLRTNLDLGSTQRPFSVTGGYD